MNYIDEPLIFEISKPGRRGVDWDENGDFDSESSIPDEMLRSGGVFGLPEVSEGDVIRHFTRLSSWNFHVDAHFYPLGSCTMKYNPRVNEKIANFESFNYAHPYQDEDDLQGTFAVLWQMQYLLGEISGMPHISLLPAAGAQGELTALLMFQAYHENISIKNGKAGGKINWQRKFILIPDSAHGTNPSSASLAGFEVKSFKSGKDGLIDMTDFNEVIESLGEDKIAGAMITNPNTLGFFEYNIQKISEILHSIGALLYIDGANFNAIIGKTNYGLMGADAVHFNLHKTFSTPHGGGGPGAGPIGVAAKLEKFLPFPIIEKKVDGTFATVKPEKSIGRIKPYLGNFSVIVRALAYIKSLGRENISKVSEHSVLNANYIKKRLEKHLHLPYQGNNLHEVVFSDKNLKKEYSVTTIDLAKALLDRGLHAPTVYFPLIVPGAIMIEPTETESKVTLDQFSDALIEIVELAKENPERIRNAPLFTKVNRLDEVQAARNPVLIFDKKAAKRK